MSEDLLKIAKKYWSDKTIDEKYDSVWVFLKVKSVDELPSLDLVATDSFIIDIYNFENMPTPYNHNHSEERKELDYDNLPPNEQLQIDYTFLQSDFTDFVKKVETVYKEGRNNQVATDNAILNMLLNKLENIIN